MIDAMREDYPLGELCEALGVSASGYHAARSRPPGPRARENRELLGAMCAIHAHRHTRCYGSPRMTRQLRRSGLRCSENRVARLMAREGLRARPRRPFWPKTTRPDHAAHPSPNLLADAAPPAAPGTHLASDITYIPTREGWLYLAVVIDLYSRAILGWDLSESLRAEGVASALRRALAGGLVRTDAIFHSDRGCQYSAASTRRLLAAHGLRQSMSAAGCCYDNAAAESFFASLKSETLEDGQPPPSKARARLLLFDYLETFYNRKRLHGALGYLTPAEAIKAHFPNNSNQLN